MKAPDVVTSFTGWITCTIIVSFITGLTTKFFSSKNQVLESTCLERRSNIEKKLDYIINRIDAHFDRKD